METWINPTELKDEKEIIFSKGTKYGLGIMNGGKIFVRQAGKDISTDKKYVVTNQSLYV